jgi:hypothetical protein
VRKSKQLVAAPAAEVFAAVADVRRITRWSPECFAVWSRRSEKGKPTRFIGWNRRGPFVWFSSCQVRVANPGTEFAFDVTALGFPVARWCSGCPVTSLTLTEPFSPRKVWIEHSDETSIPYRRSERGEDSHSVLFGTQHFDVSDLEADIIESFLSSVAARR